MDVSYTSWNCPRVVCSAVPSAEDSVISQREEKQNMSKDIEIELIEGNVEKLIVKRLIRYTYSIIFIKFHLN